MSKIITCTAALILFEKGLYLLNDPLKEYLPEFKDSQICRYTPYGALYTSPAKEPIKIKGLFTMTSGLTYDGMTHAGDTDGDGTSNYKCDE